MTIAVKALIFDVFGTVVDWRTSVIREGEALGKAKGIVVDWARFADAWRVDGYLRGVGRIFRGEDPWTSVDVIHRRKLDQLLVEFGINGLTEAETEDFSKVWHRLTPWPDAIAGLTRLRRRFTIAPLSNGNFALLTNMAKASGLPWDCIISADLFHAYKPDPRTYLGAAELLGLLPQQVMMVAAHLGDLCSARANGLRTAYVYRPLEYGPDRRNEPERDPDADLNAVDFLDLAEQLGT